MKQAIGKRDGNYYTSIMDELHEKLAGVQEQERLRTHKIDQRLFRYLEFRIIEKFVDKVYQVNDNVLNIPAEFGRFTGMLVDLPMNVFSSDIAVDRLWRVRQKFGHMSQLIANDIIRLPFKNNAFHGIVSANLLHNYKRAEERRAILQELARVTEDWVVITIYLETSIPRLAWTIKNHRKETMVGEDQIESEITQAGFLIEDSKKVLPALHPQAVYLLRIP
ncbi:MAG TPA: class I SAM-dependent methyltransferase [Balneolales bacterium]|nr:class I SAM-dependent methyltransferase [Balneolales bacterium]